MPYFAVLDSSVGNGRTVGKRLMHLQVIDKNGTTISFWKSSVRYTVFAIPYFLDEMLLPTTRTPWLVSTLVSVVVFGLGGTTVYLVIFNRHARQGIHDLAVGSCVADADKNGPLKIEPIWRVHWAILGLFLVVYFLGTVVLGDKLSQWGLFPQLLTDARVVEGMEGVQAAGVQDLSQTALDSGEKTKTLVINVYWTGKSVDKQVLATHSAGNFKENWASNQPFADQVGRLIIKHDPTVKDHDLLKVVVIRGYDLGIAHVHVSYYYQHTPAEWNARLFGVEESIPSKS
jgi:hypothetical protein